MGAGIIDDRRIEPGLAVGRWEPRQEDGSKGCRYELKGLMGARGWVGAKIMVGSQEDV